MGHHVTLLAALTPTGVLAAATVDDLPPVAGSMLDLSAYTDGPRAPVFVHCEIEGSTATPRLLTGAQWWGLSKLTGLPCLIGPAFNGVDVTISNARSAAETLELVAGVYSKIGITGTLADDGLVLRAAIVESQP